MSNVPVKMRHAPAAVSTRMLVALWSSSARAKGGKNRSKAPRKIFWGGTAARGTLQDVKRERPTSRFAAV